MCECMSPSSSPAVQPPLSGSVSPSPALVAPPPLSAGNLPPLSDSHKNMFTLFCALRSFGGSVCDFFLPVSEVSLPLLFLSEVSLPPPSSPPPPSFFFPLPAVEPLLLS